MFAPRFFGPIFLSFLLGCSSGPRQGATLAEAFVGPVTLRLRTELGPRPPDGAELKHGDRVEIVQRRRRFVRVRAANGAEGWTDLRQLLSSRQMEEMDQLARHAARMPSQGAATVYGKLNAHTEPNRQAPSFYQIHEGEQLQVVDHQVLPRVAFAPPEVIPRTPPVVRVRKPKKAEGKTPRLPRPPAPGLPENWLELSKTPEIPDLPPEPPPPPPKPVPTDDWSLVRLPNGKAGWVLTGMLRMSIPDEVAQYAEGARITSYFPMGEVRVGDTVKHHWLWTTLSENRVPYQFDSFRYFIWNVRRQRYETAYVERKLKGYYPVEVHPVRVTAASKQETYPGFSLIVEEADGERYRRTYAYQIYLVKLISKTKIEPPPEPDEATRVASAAPLADAEPDPLYKRWIRGAADLSRRWLGR
jgi:hypothetical protein